MENINLEVTRTNTEKSEEFQMIISGRLTKDGREIVRVSFVRNTDYADGILPDAIIEKSEGFDEGERFLLERYLTEHAQEIYEQARTIDPMKSLFGIGK